MYMCPKTVVKTISSLYEPFQNEREQIMTTNVWLTQVCMDLVNVLPFELELNRVHSSFRNAEQTASVIVL